MRSNWLKGLLILSLAVNAAVVGTVGYHYFINQTRSIATPCFSEGDQHLYQSLGLSETQLKKMEPLAQAFHRRLGELKASMEDKKFRLIDLLQKDGDPERIDVLRREMASIQEMIQKEVIVHIADTKRILNPDQQEQFFNLMRQTMGCSTASYAPPVGEN
jgi:Spy/CpxP family protein refolding chaperone